MLVWIDTRMDHEDEVNKVTVQQFSDSLSVHIIKEDFSNRRHFELLNWRLDSSPWNSIWL